MESVHFKHNKLVLVLLELDIIGTWLLNLGSQELLGTPNFPLLILCVLPNLFIKRILLEDRARLSHGIAFASHCQGEAL